MIGAYPARAADRSRWIAGLRGPKNLMDPRSAYAALWEEERGPGGDLVSTATIFLTNRECPYRCLMCDLWKNTLDHTVPSGAVSDQIRSALAGLPPARQVKLYNAGSFFDPNAIPPEDDAEIAELVAGFERVIVECHPQFVGERCVRFSERIAGTLEVAIGLETVHPDVLERLNKRFTVADFRRAAALLARHSIDLRVFLLVRPPFMSEEEGVFWAGQSLEGAFEAGAAAACLIPTRDGNGAMEALAARGDFTRPSLRSLEAAQEYGLRLERGRVFADLWDVEAFHDCASCSPARQSRMEEMNRTQAIPAPIVCAVCRSAAE